MLLQRTISGKITLTGLGLHTGKKVKLKLYPAGSDEGIVFHRTDIKGHTPIKAELKNVSALENATCLGKGNEQIFTVEHLLAALYGMGINNVHCELDGPEVPVMDGSSAPFIFILSETGIRDLSKERKFLVIKEPLKVQHQEKWAAIYPSTSLIIDSTIDYDHPVIKKQQERFVFSCENFINEVSRARTFGMLKDLDYLQSRGLAKGCSLDNVLALDEFSVINKEPLRYEKEFVKHKILDSVGDLSLLGMDLVGEVVSYRSGHYLNNLLCQEIMKNPDAYEILSASDLKEEVKHKFRLPVAIASSY